MSSVKQTDHYKALGISPQASPREIKQSYLGWIRYFDHPEERPKPGPLQGSLTEQIEQVQDAYNLLSDTEKREQYNHQINIVADSPETDAAEGAAPPRAVAELEGMIEKRQQARCYLEFFGLSEKPFESTPDPKFFYLSSRHKEVLAQLILALKDNRGIVKILGEGGTGKTTLCRSFLKELDSGFEFAYLFHPCADTVELMQYINAEFGLPSQSRNKNELLFHLMRFVVKMKNEGRGVAVVVDEAQNLVPEALEELRILSNMETEKEKLLQIVLLGQPDLNRILRQPLMNLLQQRISAQWDLVPLNVEETHGYIQHRLNVSGGKGKVAFSRSAADVAFRYSGGLPRLINRLADQALAVAYLEGVKKIDRRIIRQAEKELGEIQPKSARGSRVLKWMTLLLALAGLAAAAFYYYYDLQSASALNANNLTQRIERTPLNLFQPGKLVPQAPPKTRTLASTGNPAQELAPEAGGALSAPSQEESLKAITISREEELIRELSALSTSESRIEAARWVLKRWGAFKKETVPLTPKAKAILKADYGLSVYESNGNLNRLTTLNYPALVELRLPEGKGSRYLALVGLKGDVGVFRSNETFEIPLALFDSLWTHKAIVLWKNFESLPGNMKIGYKGEPAVWLQRQLNRLGYYNALPAPRYGGHTADAVAKFQRYYNLKDHGRLDTETKMILYNRLPSYRAPQLTGG